MVLYGLIQTADVELSTHWDWIGFLNVQASFGPTSTVWSTFGNPNHLAGFVACLLPIGIIVVISDRSVVTRVLAGAVLAGGLLCLVETSSLGGFGAATGALVLTTLLLIPELRARKRMAAWLGAGVAAALAVAVVIVAAQGTLGHKLDAATEWSSGTSTAAQRVQFWHFGDRHGGRPTAARLGARHVRLHVADVPDPEVRRCVRSGSGDQRRATTRSLRPSPRRGSSGWRRCSSSSDGFALRAWGGWRHVRARERTNPEWREQRLVLTAAIGAAVGVLLQNSFNVEIIGINVVLWATAAAVSVVALGAGVPVSLNPAAIMRVAADRRTRAARAAAPPAPATRSPQHDRSALGDRCGRRPRALVVRVDVVAGGSLVPAGRRGEQRAW